MVDRFPITARDIPYQPPWTWSPSSRHHCGTIPCTSFLSKFIVTRLIFTIAQETPIRSSSGCPGHTQSWSHRYMSKHIECIKSDNSRTNRTDFCVIQQSVRVLSIMSTWLEMYACLYDRDRVESELYGYVQRERLRERERERTERKL